MGSTDLIKQVDALIKPLKVRRDYYTAASKQLVKLINGYFFTEANKPTLIAVSRVILGAELNECPGSELLSAQFTSLGHFSDAILSTNLGFHLEGDFFEFSDERCSPEAKEFMKKLAHALSMLRLCYKTSDTYTRLLENPCLKFDDRDHSILISELKANYDKPDASTSLVAHLDAWHYATTNAHEKIKSETVSDENATFVEDVVREANLLHESLLTAGLRLIASLNEFTDRTWMGDGWRTLARQMLYQLFDGNYQNSWHFVGAVTLRPEFLDRLKAELDAFSTVQTPINHLKLALRNEATTELEELMKMIVAKQEEAGRSPLPIIYDAGYASFFAKAASIKPAAGGPAPVVAPTL